jgi:predicted transcriptional regulator
MVMKELMEKHNMRKIDASAKMELTPAAITQYFKGERGAIFIQQLSHSEGAMRKVSELADALARDDTPIEVVLEKLCSICNAVRSEGIICDIHHKDLPSLKACTCPTCQPHA